MSLTMSMDIEKDLRELRRLEKLRKLQEMEEEFRKKSVLLGERWLQKQKKTSEILDEKKLEKDRIFVEKIREEERNGWIIPYQAKNLENTQKIKTLLKEGEIFSQQINKDGEKIRPKKSLKLPFLHFRKKNK